MNDQPRPGDQPLPTPSTGPGMHDLVIADLNPSEDAALIDLLVERRQIGWQRYAEPLQAHNGRDALQDALEECADGVVYVRQLQVEGVPSHRLERAEHHLLMAARILLDARRTYTRSGVAE